MTNWRTTFAGGVLLAFAVLRIAFKHDAIFEPATAGIVTGGCSLILGSDKLLGK